MVHPLTEQLVGTVAWPLHTNLLLFWQDVSHVADIKCDTAHVAHRPQVYSADQHTLLGVGRCRHNSGCSSHMLQVTSSYFMCTLLCPCCQVADHTTRALWLGQQPAGAYGGIKVEGLAAMEEKAAAEGWTEEDYSEYFKKH